MSWKQKEVEITESEALAIAKTELAPRWVGSSPLLLPLKNGEKWEAYPLEPKFNEKNWVLAFIDSTHFLGLRTLSFFQELHKRYHSLDVEFLLFLSASYHFFKVPKIIEQWIKKNHFSFPSVIDIDRMYFDAFGCKDVPQLIWYSHGKPVFEKSGEQLIAETESEIHRFLRTHDPGLALLPFYKEPQRFYRDVSQIEFGKGKGALFPSPGFNKNSGNFMMASFAPAPRPEKISKNSLYMCGNWIQDMDRIVTSDPQAKIGFHCHTSSLSLVAESLSKERIQGKIFVEVNDLPTFDAFKGEDLLFDEEGFSLARVEGPQFYHLLSNLPPDSREITLRFPSCEKNPIALYGLRFGQKLHEDA